MINPNALHVNDLVLQQVPSFIRENHQKFVDFLTNYYEYLDQDQNINDYIRNIVSYMDVDQTTLHLLNDFFEELRDLPGNLVVDKRLLIKHIHDLYDTKGTIKSFELLFRILFNEDVTIDYPSKYILRASDGVWKQEVFITIEMIGGSLPIDGSVIHVDFENQNGRFRLTPTKISPDELFSDMTIKSYRVYFNANDRLKVIPDQVFKVFNVLGERSFIGRLKKSPTRVTILDGGKFWQRGALFTIPGSRMDSICRVVNTEGNGKITHIEILQYGMGHSENQSIIISPFPNKPSGASIYFEKTLVSYNPTVYAHSLTINDYTDGIEESTVGLGTKHDQNSYFSEDYVDGTYTGQISFVTQDSYSKVDMIYDEDVTIQDWLASRATFVVEFDYITREKGSYDSERGKISNPLIRLQDNQYYQIFSYVIKTETDLPKYKNALSLIHPAGTKFFAELQKSFTYDVAGEISVERSMSVDRLLLSDRYETFDTLVKTVSKTRDDSISSSDSIQKSLNKYVTDSYQTTMTDTTTTNKVTYNTGDFFAEQYMQSEIITTIQ